MNKIVTSILSGLFMMGTAHAESNGFAGSYFSVKVGKDNSSAHSTVAYKSNNSAYAGLEGGYYAREANNVLIGFDVWADDRKKSVTGRDYGGDVQLAYEPSKNMLYYIKFAGIAASNPGTRPHYGLGLRYMVAGQFSALLEWTQDKTETDGISYRNNSVMTGITYHLNDY